MQLSLLDQIIEDEIRDLESLKRLAQDPKYFALMQKIVKAVEGEQANHKSKLPIAAHNILGTGSASPQFVDDGPAVSVGVTQSVLTFIKLAKGEFTVASIAAALKADGFRFVAKPTQAVQGPIQGFLKKGIIKCTFKGQGGLPSRYVYPHPTSSGNHND